MSLSTNHNLEELFDLPVTEKVDDPTQQINSDVQSMPNLPETLDALGKIEAALPAVRGLEASDTEMDELASAAKESFDNLMDLGMQVDSRYASEIFAVAGTMLGHAITAKTAKLNKKLKMIDLQLKKARLDQTDESPTNLPTAQGRVLNRNDLLRTLLAKTDEDNGADK